MKTGKNNSCVSTGAWYVLPNRIHIYDHENVGEDYAVMCRH